MPTLGKKKADFKSMTSGSKRIEKTKQMKTKLTEQKE